MNTMRGIRKGKTLTVYDDFIRLGRELEEFEPGDDLDGIMVYPEQRL